MYDIAYPTADFNPRIRENFCIIVVGVVVENSKVLLIQEAKQSCYGKYFLPAGRLEVGETLRDGVRREFQEESGLEFRPIGIALVETNGPFWLSITFTGEVVGGHLKTVPDTESLQAGWFSLDQVREADRLWNRDRYHVTKQSVTTGRPDDQVFAIRAPVTHMIEAALRFRAALPSPSNFSCQGDVGDDVRCMLYRLAIVWAEPGRSADRPSHLLIRLSERFKLPTFRLNGGTQMEAINLFIQNLLPDIAEFNWDRHCLSILDLTYNPRSCSTPASEQAESLTVALRIILLTKTLPSCRSSFKWFPIAKLQPTTSCLQNMLRVISLPFDTALLPSYLC